jgi:ABC-type Fe3+/spermidine/putrescine transport system ATPase subunit
VARFLGESNLLPGAVRHLAGGRAALEVPGLAELIEGRAGPGLAPGEAAAALMRPEMIRPLPAGSGGVPARVLERVYLGELLAVRLALDPARDGEKRPGALVPAPGRGFS